MFVVAFDDDDDDDDDDEEFDLILGGSAPQKVFCMLVQMPRKP
jgi:hypothetical protein